MNYNDFSMDNSFVFIVSPNRDTTFHCNSRTAFDGVQGQFVSSGMQRTFRDRLLLAATSKWHRNTGDCARQCIHGQPSKKESIWLRGRRTVFRSVSRDHRQFISRRHRSLAMRLGFAQRST